MHLRYIQVRQVNSNPPQLLHDHVYQDMVQFAQAVGWDLDFRQLETGELDARATVIGSPDVFIVKYDLNRCFHQLGSAPPGMLTFGILDVCLPGMTWRSKPTPGGTLANFNLGGEFDCVTDAGFVAYGVSISVDVLQGLAEQMGISTPVESLVRNHESWLSPNTRSLGRALRSIFRRTLDFGSGDLAEHSEFINEELGSRILEELSRDSLSLVPIEPANRVRILKKAMEILNDKHQLPISVANLCARVGTSSSSLNRIFLTEFGVSPKKYIRARTLSAVRDELASGSTEKTIVNIANAWGFWHMGQFAHDFRMMFGESPSIFKARFI